MQLNAENLEMKADINGVIQLEPSYLGYLRENGHPVDGINEVHTVPSESDKGSAHLVMHVETTELPTDHQDADVVADQMNLWVCDCADYTYRQSVDVSETNFQQSNAKSCKHIDQVEQNIEKRPTCDECGASFNTEVGVKRHKTRGHSDHMDSQKLGELYWVDELSMRDVADRLDTDSGTISRWLDRFGIAKRNKSQAKGGYEFTATELEELYVEQEKSTIQIAEEYGLDPSTISRKLSKHSIETRSGLSASGDGNWPAGKYWHYGPNWESQREKRLRKDGEKCVVCGMGREKHKDKFQRDICVHHITPRHKFLSERGEFDHERANDIENLITLCTPCHRKWEGIELRPQK